MYTEFGKWLKMFRISIGVRLYDMSETIGVSPSFISAVESGKKNIPLDFVDKIKARYILTPMQEETLDEAVKATREEELKRKKACQVKVETTSNEVQELDYAFARRADELTESEKRAMWKILNNGA